MAYREGLKYLASRWELQDSLLPDRKAGRGHCPFSEPSPTEPQNQQAGVVSQTPSTWLTLFSLLWRSPETLYRPSYQSTQAAFPFEWLVLAPASQLPKSSQTSNSQPPRPPQPPRVPSPCTVAPDLILAANSLDSQLGFTWEPPSPAVSDCFIAQAGCPQAKQRWGLTLACTAWETPEPTYSSFLWGFLKYLKNFRQICSHLNP